MTEHNPQGYGLGAIPSPPDERDFPIEQLYALTGKKRAAPPATYRVPGQLQQILDQGSTPQCVAFSFAALKGTEDRIDQGAFFPWDENTFFVRIGGGPNGAIVRNAFKEGLANGYPLVGEPAAASQHKIAAYYAVSVTAANIQSAIMDFGPVVFGMTWLNSMFAPKSNGILTCDPASGVGGGHAILVVGWTVINGVSYFILRNSWGASWGLSGEAYLPFSELSALVGEVWKAVDVIEVPTVMDFKPAAPAATCDVLAGGAAYKTIDGSGGVWPTPVALKGVPFLGYQTRSDGVKGAWVVLPAGLAWGVNITNVVTPPVGPNPPDYLAHVSETNGVLTITPA